jgi:pantoate--beta-alanine ligase
MITVDRIAALRNLVRDWRAQGARIGFVPTMGSLHDGHMSLLTAARERADCVVASVFVNPLQFGPGEDFERYPRTPEEDSKLLAAAGCDLLFLPGVEEIYPDGRQSATRVSVPSLSQILCGAFRPGHFDGVATIVAKLFGIVQPDLAVFGEKDYQQLAIIRRMTADLDLPVQIVGAPTVRGADGLAMSSRNRYLSAADRATAPQIYATLHETITQIAAGERDYSLLEEQGAAALRAAGMQPDYFAVRDAASLQPPDATTREVVVLTAARLGKARLIDNLRVALPSAVTAQAPS